MIIEIQAYMTTQLKAAMGANTIVLYTQKELTDLVESHMAAVLLEGETLVKSGVRSGPGNRLKLYERACQYSIVMGEYNKETLEPMYTAMVASMGVSIPMEDGTVAALELGNPEWTHKEDGILKAKVAVLIPVTVTGGIYQPIPTTMVSSLNIAVEQED